MRTFVCLELPAEIKNQIAAVQNELKKVPTQVSWVKPGNIHITLKFLGEIEDDTLEEVFSATEGACRGLKKFKINLKGVGAFPNLGRPKVIWVGTENGAGELSALQEKVERELESIGFPREEKRFTPHFTIGRIKIPKRVDRLSRAVERFQFETPEFGVEEVVVMKSQLHPAGSIYTPLKKIILAE